jgi:hypothetical protein
MAERNGTDGQVRREEIHLPGNSVLPMITALGVTMALTGLILSDLFIYAGLLLTAVCIVRWVSIVGKEIENLPTDRPE